jgi:outer membrane protein assembly factor BamB
MKRILALLSLLTTATLLSAEDWPQWRGPKRAGVSDEKGLLQAWPEKGPKLVWTFDDCGLGFSSFSVVGDRLYTMGARKEETYVIAIDAGMGKQVWSAKVGKIFTYSGNYWGDGPRSTPTIDGDLLYALGGHGDLVCLQTKDGKEVWRKNLVKDFGGEMMSEWGYSESVLVDGPNVICTPGGKTGTLAALDKKTGEMKWRSKELTAKAPYSSIMPATLAGVRQYVQAGYIDDIQGGILSAVAADDGRLLWSESIFKGSSYAVAPTPIIKGDQVYMTSGYGGGCHLFEITAAGDKLAAKELYSSKNRKTMKNTHGGVVLVGEHIYGHSERLGWVCQEFKSGDVVWMERFDLPSQSGAITYADGNLYLYDEEGNAALVKANPEKWELISKFEIPQKSKLMEGRPTSRSAKIWAHPVVANGRLYLRDQEFIFCYDVKK